VGVAGAPGIAIGPVHQFRPSKFEVHKTASNPTEERDQLRGAIAAAQTELHALHAEVSKRIGAHEAAIFEAHLAILDDPELLETTHAQINEGSSAAWAWQNTIESRAAQLAELKDELLAARATDVRDAGNQVLRVLVGAVESKAGMSGTPVVLVAEDLTPSDTVTFDVDHILGLCTATGGVNSHTAILARALGLPGIVGAGPEVLDIPAGSQVILDGNTGMLTVDPDAKVLAAAEKAQYQQKIQRTAELKAAAEPAVTQDGHRMKVMANIGGLKNAKQAKEFGAEGVGLLRTEFLFLERTTLPTEEEQFGVFRDIAQALENQPIIVRTLDVGGDKPLAYLPLPHEENPFLGVRGIRLCLARPEILRTQIRAILRAAKFGPYRIMFPMIANLEEWRIARQMVEEVRAELNGLSFEVGIMVEVPAAALLANNFAREVDFFSIGTNDLTQYTLAMDRTNPAVSSQADGLHPAVLRLIDQTVQAAHAAGKWVGVCGELGADPEAVPILVGLGVDELSVSTPAIPTVKAQIRTLTLDQTQALAAQALQCDTAAEVRKLIVSA
jgi:phosphocarrier protein FPr